MRVSNRAERRHHVQRLKRNRRNYWGYPRRTYPLGVDAAPVAREPMEAKQLGMVVHTPQLCSCSGCGNTRRHAWFKGERLTLEERRRLVQYAEQLGELDEQQHGNDGCGDAPDRQASESDKA
jgi:hypothetical protein